MGGLRERLRCLVGTHVIEPCHRSLRNSGPRSVRLEHDARVINLGAINVETHRWSRLGSP